MTTLLSLSLAAVLGAGPAATAGNPEADRTSLKVPDGFEVQLFAADPAIAKPVQMNFDSKGRLWLASSASYPQTEPGAEPADKVFIVEDTDGDGKADKTTVFADKLMMPTGIEIGDGGAYVGHGTEVLHLSDTDGDGKADKTRVVLSAFGTEDTHHLVHTFRWGPNGSLFFAQSVYIHSHVETPWGVERLNGGGFWILDPRSQRLRVLTYGMVNTWGIAWDNFGQAFGVDNDHRDPLKYFLPGSRMAHTPAEPNILAGLIPDKPKYCGAEFVTGRHFPDDWSGDLITGDFRAHRVCRYRITDDGAGYKAEELEPLVSSSNITFRPIDMKMGPDGAMYICDWYNPIINHGEVDFRDPRRDKTHGRIWRIVHKSRPLSKRPDFDKASVDQLLDMQKEPEDWTRHFARRVLSERPKKDVLPALAAWTAKQTDEVILERALWTYQSIDEVSLPILKQCLAAKDGKIRAAATYALADWYDRIPVNESDALLAKLVVDDHPRVRMEAVRALSLSNVPKATIVALNALDKPMDRFLDYALKLTCRETSDRWLSEWGKSLKADSLSADAAKKVTYGLLAVGSERTAGPLLELWRAGKISADSQEKVLASITKFGQPDQLRLVFDAIVAHAETGTPASEKVLVLRSLGEASRLRRVQPSGDLATALQGLLNSKEAPLRKEAIRLAGMWRVAAVQPAVLAMAQQKDAPADFRKTAIESLGHYGGKPSIDTLASLSSGNEANDIRLAAIDTLVTLNPKAAAQTAKQILTTTKDVKEASNIYGAFLKQRNGPDALAEALTGTTLSTDIASEGVRAASVSGRMIPGFVSVLSKAGNLPETSKALTPQQMQTLVAAIDKQGDPANGEAIYKSKKIECVKCHVIKGQGGKVGPDLSTIGASVPMDYLVESLLLPNAKVKEGFHSMVVATSDGQLITGLEVKRSPEELILRNADDKLVSIPVKDIEDSKMGGSIMPSGLTDSLNEKEFRDLVKYMSLLGKPGQYGSGEEKVVREWRILGPFQKPAGETMRQDLLSQRSGSVPQQWIPTKVANAGWLFVSDIAKVPNAEVLFAATKVEAKKAGKARWILSPPTSMTLWLNGEPLKPVRTDGQEAWYDVALKEGMSTVLVEIDLPKSTGRVTLKGYALEEGFDFAFKAGEPTTAAATLAPSSLLAAPVAVAAANEPAAKAAEPVTKPVPKMAESHPAPGKRTALKLHDTSRGQHVTRISIIVCGIFAAVLVLSASHAFGVKEEPKK